MPATWPKRPGICCTVAWTRWKTALASVQSPNCGWWFKKVEKARERWALARCACDCHERVIEPKRTRLPAAE